MDAASSWGIGGFHGDRYFLIPNAALIGFETITQNCKGKHIIKDTPPSLLIAHLELLAALVGIICFVPHCKGRIIRLNSDNTDAVAWLQKSRCSAGLGFRMLAVIELYKHQFRVKISTRHIKGVANRSADFLSRGKIPAWLKIYGSKCEVDLDKVINLVANPLSAWKNVLLSERTTP